MAVTHAQHVIAVVSIAACCGAFALAWIAGALYNASRGSAQNTRAPLGRFAVVVVIAGAIFFAIFRAVPAHTWRSLGWESPWATGIGLVIQLGSTAFTLWARFALGTMWTLDAKVKEGHALRTDGPYAITRHPIHRDPWHAPWFNTPGGRWTVAPAPPRRPGSVRGQAPR